MPLPQSAGSGTSGRSTPWWVVQKPVPGSHVAGWIAVQSGNRPTGAVAGPFKSQAAAQHWRTTRPGINLPNPLHVVQGWLGGLGGMIGSGIEAGVIQTVKDVFDVILGPLEVIIGVVIAAFVLVVYFRDDITSMVGMIGMAAAA